MDDEAAALMLCRGILDPELDNTTRSKLGEIYKAIPIPPVSAAAPLSRASAAWLTTDGVDRISGLPVEILRNVVGRLPSKDAARTAALSTRWRGLWHSVPLALVDGHLLPAFEVDQIMGIADFLQFAKLLGIGRRRQGQSSSRAGAITPESRALVAAVSGALAAHPGPFRCVHLSCTSMAQHQPEMARWLDILAAKGVQELVFIDRPGPYYARGQGSLLCLPPVLFSCGASLTRLYIGVWKFPDTAALRRAAAFPHLRELGLCSIFMSSEEDLALLLNKCPALEILVILASLSMLQLRVVSRSLRCVQVCTSIAEELSVEYAPNLERFLMWEALGIVLDPSKLVEGNPVLPPMRARVKIGGVPKLRILGFLMPGIHELQIGNTIIKPRTKVNPRTMVPSVQMLGIQVNLGIGTDARMMPSFLRCFPNVETLYVQSDNPDNSAGKLDVKFWKEADPIECVQGHIKKLVFREFGGQRSEQDFLKFIAERAQVLEKMVIVLTHGCSVHREGAKLRAFMASAHWANEGCKLTVLASPFPEQGTSWCFQRALNFSILDPFDTFTCANTKGLHACRGPC